MSEWGVADFVSRVAGRVSLAGEELAAQLVERHPAEYDIDGFDLFASAFPIVEPAAEFLVLLRQGLIDAPIVTQSETSFLVESDRRVIYYSAAAVGSLASAALVTVLLLRNRAAHQPAA